MNRYPLWKYLLILAIVVPGLLYFLPNLYGEDPAIQVSAVRGKKPDTALMQRVESALETANIAISRLDMDEAGVRARFADTDTQFKAREVVALALGDAHTVALNLIPATPRWLDWINARPMYLGLDLRGGVHFLLQVDMQTAIKKGEEGLVEDFRTVLREKKIRYLTIARPAAGGLELRFRDAAERDKARDELHAQYTTILFEESERPGESLLLGRLSEAAMIEKRKLALEQNILSLRNRVNELGIAEPVIQAQGADRIVVQLPGVQDTAKAKEILGRTATLEIMLVDEEAAAGGSMTGANLYYTRDKFPIPLKRPVLYSGDNIVDAAAGFDSQQGGAIVHITLDARGAAVNQRVTGENIGKRMAVVYIETRNEIERDATGNPVLDADGRPLRTRKRVEEVITAPVVRDQLGKRFQISGLDSTEESRDLALLLRAGALSAPVEIIEERTVGPSLGADNIERGFNSTLIGFAAITIFMVIYYRLFGVIACIALASNVFLLIAVLSLLQATLTLPGIAGIALTVGMAIDANVLIAERIREELRNGNTPQAAIHAGFDRAFDTITDSNVTTLIAGFALFWLGSGPVRGFAVVLCIGIITSMFSAVMVSRAIVNLTWGRSRRLQSVSV